MRTAIVHDWLNGMRGGEKVLETLLEAYPSAPIYTLFHEANTVSSAIESRPIVTSWLDRIPGIYQTYRNFLPLFPSAIESFEFRDYDLVISSSHSVAKGVRAGKAVHVCYCHTPARYIWDAEEDYGSRPLRHLGLSLVRSRLRQWDCQTTRSVHHFVADSRFVAQRIRLYYGRDSDVIYPPIDTDFFKPDHLVPREEFYLAAGALVPYKRFDLVIKAFNNLNRRLVVAGKGPELKRLQSIAGSNIQFLGWVSNEQLRHLYRTAKAMVFAGREDFGMVSAEAISTGCPVIAFSAGGSAEIIRDAVNGILFTEQDTKDLICNIHRFETMSWPVERVRLGVEGLSRAAFRTKIRRCIELQTTQRQQRRQEVPQSA